MDLMTINAEASSLSVNTRTEEQTGSNAPIVTTELHTEGPWTAEPGVDRDGGFYIGNDGEIAAVVNGYTDHPGNMANAKLVAAAPKMLVALKRIANLSFDLKLRAVAVEAIQEATEVKHA
jgi:hypothetical protein